MQKCTGFRNLTLNMTSVKTTRSIPYTPHVFHYLKIHIPLCCLTVHDGGKLNAVVISTSHFHGETQWSCHLVPTKEFCTSRAATWTPLPAEAHLLCCYAVLKGGEIKCTDSWSPTNLGNSKGRDT